MTMECERLSRVSAKGRVASAAAVGLGLTLVLVWLLHGALGRAHAAEFTVTNNNASGPGSLRQAVIGAEGDSAHDTIDFAPGVSGTIVLTAALPVIDHDLTIKGPGAEELAVSGDNRSYRVFEIDSGAAVTITELTIRDGRVTGPTDDGGGLYVNGGASLVLSGTHVISNSVTGSDRDGGGVYVGSGSARLHHTRVVSNSADGRGGGVFVYTATATLEMNGGRIGNNWARASGGGVYVDYGSATLNGTEVAGNSARADQGGGVCVSDGSVTLNGATVISNSAGQRGGGLYAHRGVAALVGARVGRNRAGTDGGGVSIRQASASAALTATWVVSNSAGNNGGGVNAHNAVATLSDTRVERNSAGDIGGGVYVHGGSATLTGTRVVSNSATNGGGLVIGSSGGGITATDGCVVFNSDTAVRDIGGGSLDARDNWWGMPDGPSGQGSGRGDSVGINVAFSPYKSSPPPGCPAYMDVVISKDVTPTKGVAKGGTVSYTVTVRNSGPLSDANVLCTDTLPGELEFGSWVISATGTVLDPVVEEITWGGTVTNGEALTWTFTAVHVGDYADVVTNTGEFSGTVRAGEVDAVFSVAAPDIKAHPLSLTFGSQDVAAGASPRKTVTITNEGDADLGFTAPITITGTDPSAFAIASDSGEDPLPPGGTRTVEVAFDPASAGVKSAALTIESDDPDEATVNVGLSGTGLDREIVVAPMSLSFGSQDVLVGASPTKTVTITNEGDADLGFTGPVTLTGSDAGAFVVAGDTGEDPLPPGGTRTVLVAFDPASVGAKSATLTIESDDADEATVNVDLSGTGTRVGEPGYGSDPAPGVTIDVGAVAVGGTVSGTLTVSETGEATLVVTPTLDGPDAACFGVSPSALTIADGEAPQNVTIDCTPSVQGTLAATLTVAHNAMGSPALYPLTCGGEAYRIYLPVVIRGS